MGPIHARRITGIAIALAIALTACSFNNGYVLDVTIDGGDRTLALGDPLTLTATVAHYRGATNRVTWTTSDDTIATVDTTGLVTTLAQGPTQITATSTSDPSKNDTITLTITEPNAVANLTIDGGDRTIVLGDPLTLTATLTTTGTADDTITWTSSDQTVATIDATGTVTTITDGTTDLTATSVFDPSQRDTITLTVDPRGAPRWTRQFGTAADDIAYGVATDANGNVYVAGITFGAFDGTNEGNPGDAFLRAYDPNGTPLWTQQFGTPAFDRATGVATDPNGNVYVVGITFGALVGVNEGEQDAFLRAYDPNGTPLWTQQFGSDYFDQATGVATDANGNAYVTGYTNGDLNGTNVGGNDGFLDAFLRAYDANGTELWSRQFDPGSVDLAYGVATDTNDHIYVAGVTFGALEGSSAGEQDAFLRAYDTNGTELWIQQFGTAAFDFAYGVATDATGLIYVTGYTAGDSASTTGPNDAFLHAYDSNGVELWTQPFGTAAFDFAYGVATDATGHIYVTGTTTGALGVTQFGGFDAFLSVHDANGTELRIEQFGTATFDRANGVTADANGNVYVIGYTDGALEDTFEGGSDAFLRAYGR